MQAGGVGEPTANSRDPIDRRDVRLIAFPGDALHRGYCLDRYVDPGGIAAISRWSSAANTTGTPMRKPSILKGSQRDGL